jgi:YggT family protein
MAAVIFILGTLVSLAMLAVLLRLILQWARADFRNPLARALLQLTNPLVVPLRRVLPAVGRIDTASVLLVLLLAMLRVSIGWLLPGLGLPPPLLWLRMALYELLSTLLWTYFLAIFFYALIAMIAPEVYSPAQSLLRSVCEPVLRPIRRMIPPLGGLDLSPLWAGIAIQALLILLR